MVSASLSLIIVAFLVRGSSAGYTEKTNAEAHHIAIAVETTDNEKEGERNSQTPISEPHGPRLFARLARLFGEDRNKEKLNNAQRGDDMTVSAFQAMAQTAALKILEQKRNRELMALDDGLKLDAAQQGKDPEEYEADMADNYRKEAEDAEVSNFLKDAMATWDPKNFEVEEVAKDIKEQVVAAIKEQQEENALLGKAGEQSEELQRGLDRFDAENTLEVQARMLHTKPVDMPYADDVVVHEENPKAGIAVLDQLIRDLEFDMGKSFST